MAETTLGIKVDSSQAKSGAAEVRAELAQIKALFADVVSLSQSVGVSLGRNMDAAASATTKATTAIENATKASKGHKAAVESEADQMSRLKAMVASSAAEYEKTSGAQARAEMMSKKYAVSLEEVQAKSRATWTASSSLTDALNAYSNNAGKAGNESAKAGTAFSGMAGGFKNGSFVVQQAGYQLADVAAQAANGGLSFAAVGVQMGQLVGAFGAYGAAAGAAITVGGVLADMLLKGGNAAQSAAAKQKDYNAALDAGQIIIDRYTKAQDRAAGKGDTWRKDKERISDLKQELQDLQVQMDLLEYNKSKYGAAPLVGTNSSEIEDVRVKMANVRVELREAQKALVETAPVTLGSMVRPGSQDAADLREQQAQIQTAIDAATSAYADAAQGKGDATKMAALSEKLQGLTATYEALSHAVATYATESEKAALRADAQAKAATMGENEGKKYLATRNAEIDLMGRAVVAGERENTMRAASVGVAADQAKAYSDAQKQIALAAVSSNANLATAGIDAEKERISQRRALLEISAADEIALQREQDDRKRQVDLEAAQQRLAVLRRTHPEEYAQIDAAERSITDLRAKQANERQKQLDAEVAARAAAARQMAQIQADAVAQEQTAALSVKQENLSFGVSMGGVNASDAIASERQIAEERYQIEKELLEKKLQLVGIEESERARINAQLVALENQRSLHVLQIDHKETQQRIASVKEWTDPVKQGAAATVTSFVTSSNTIGQAARRGAQTVASAYIGKSAEMAADWFNKRVVMAAWDRMFAAQEVTTRAATETRKTAAVVTGQAAQTTATRTGAVARNTATASEGSGFLTRIGEMLGEWLGFETSKTAQTSVGAAERGVAETTAATTAIAAAKAQAAAEIPSFAGIGAAAAMASVAAIPVWGWAAAPAVGAEHFSTAMGYMAAASAEGGWGEVPKDGVVTELHKQEMVLPAKFAVPLRAMLTGGGQINAADGVTLSAAAGVKAGAGMVLPGIVNRSQLAMPQVVTNNNSATKSVSRGGDIHVHINGGVNDAKGIRRLFEQEGKTLMKVVRTQKRDFDPNAR